MRYFSPSRTCMMKKIESSKEFSKVQQSKKKKRLTKYGRTKYFISAKVDLCWKVKPRNRFYLTQVLNLIRYFIFQCFNDIELVPKDHFLRKSASAIVLHPYFQRLSLLIILANSAVIAIADYSKVDVNNNLVMNRSIRNTVYLCSDLWFTIFFIAEFLMKITAFGFIGRSPTYLSDAWNWLDFIVVIAG